MTLGVPGPAPRLQPREAAGEGEQPCWHGAGRARGARRAQPTASRLCPWHTAAARRSGIGPWGRNKALLCLTAKSCYHPPRFSFHKKSAYPLV